MACVVFLEHKRSCYLPWTSQRLSLFSGAVVLCFFETQKIGVLVRVLVTGATGFVGRVLCATFSAQGVIVRAAVRRATLVNSQQESVLVPSLDQATAWAVALRDIQVVVHLAARVHVLDDHEHDPLAAFRRVNVEGTLNLARQAAAAGVRRFVFVSSVKVNGEQTEAGRPFKETDPPAPVDAYGQSKWEAEQGLWALSRETGLDVVVVRPPLVYGAGVKANFAALVRAVCKGWPLPFAAVDNQRSLVALDNLVDFLITVCTHPLAEMQTFLISDGCDVSSADLMREIGRAADCPARLLYIPKWVLLGLGALAGKKLAMQRLCGNLQVDCSKARELLGWQPVVRLAQGLRGVVEHKD